MTEEHTLDALLYEAGELTPAATTAFEAHLKGCPECRVSVDLARRGHSWGAALAEGPAPETLGGVFARPTPYPWIPVLRFVGATTFACAALAVVAFFNRPEPDLSWQSDLPVRIWTLQQRLGETRARAGELRTETVSWE